ncbi:hypothetical protein [Postechiella marina]|uniref:hypothetical protein n=1 Tax=Postechiella marina TaxID=943941 RepID=UPI0031D9174D
MAYYQINIDYITQNFCENKDKIELACNGKCHLSKQLQAETTSNNNSKTIQIFTEYFFPVFYQNNSEFKLKQQLLQLNKNVKSVYNKRYAFNYNSFHFRPPIV